MAKSLLQRWLVDRDAFNFEAPYDEKGEYSYGGSGWNWRAMAALIIGILPNLPGFLHAASNGAINPPAFFNSLYDYAWFVSLSVAGLAHLMFACGETAPPQE